MGFLAVPTSRGVLLLMIAVISTAVAFMNSGLITALTASLLDAAVLSGFIMTLFSAAGVRITRKFPQHGVCGEQFPVEFTIENRLPLFRQSCTVIEKLPFAFPQQCAFDLPALAPKEKRTFSCSVSAGQRGDFMLEKFSWYSGDPLGLFRKEKKFRQPARVLVYPRDLKLQTLPLSDKRSNIADMEGRPLGRAGRGMEFFGVRPYRQGDEVRNIHWKSTASKGRIMVKEFEDAAVDQIVIILDTDLRSSSLEPCDNNFEFLITCANSIIISLSTRYCRLRLIAAEGKNELVDISGDAASIKNKIRNTLSGLNGSRQQISDVLSQTVENIPQRSHVFLLTMSHDRITEYITMMKEQCCSCFWIWAPPELFPVIENDRPRIIKKKDLSRIFGDSDDLPFVADFTSGAELIENRSPDEKTR